MAYYYISSTGTATGDAGRYATLQTGTSAAVASYATLAEMLLATTPEVGGDYVVFFDDYVGSDTAFSSLSNRVFMIAVSALNGSLSRRSGFYPTITFSTATFDNISVSGFQFDVSTYTLYSQSVVYNDMYYDLDLNETVWYGSTDGGSCTANNCTVTTLGPVGSAMGTILRGSLLDVNNITLLTTASGKYLYLVTGFALGGGRFRCTNSDLSRVEGTLVYNVGGNLADDMIDVRVDNCKLATGVLFTNETFKAYGQRALFTRCSDVSAEAEYQYHLHAFGGDVWDEAAIYRNEDTAFTESNQKISYKIETNSDASLGFPLWLDFPMSQYVLLTTTSTLEFYITCATALTDKDIYITVGYTDATNKNTTNNVISAPETAGGTLDLLAAGTTLTTDATSTWTGGLANLYKIVIDCPTGADCQPTIRLNVTKPSTVLHIASEYELS